MTACVTCGYWTATIDGQCEACYTSTNAGDDSPTETTGDDDAN